MKNRLLSFVTCANDPNVLSRRLLASPCLAGCDYTQAVYLNAPSAAAAFNAEVARPPAAQWLVWVHQDVFLPPDWDRRFIAAITEAEAAFAKLAVVGVYGVAGAGDAARRAGHVLDRGTLLREATPLPCRADSIDELLFAVRVDAGLRLDHALGFDFYATDVALSAQARGFDVAVVDACCEHWSDTPRGNPPPSLATRVARSGDVFERKWALRLPVDTTCFSISEVGDVALQCKQGGTVDS